MSIHVFMLVGHIGAGKTTLASTIIEATGASVVHTSKLIPGATRREKQQRGDELDASTNGAWIVEHVRAAIFNNPFSVVPTPVIVDAVRHPGQIDAIRTVWPTQSVLIGVRSRSMREHIQSRNLSLAEHQELIKALHHPLEKNIDAVMATADIIVDNTRFSSEVLIQLFRRGTNGTNGGQIK